MKIKRFLIRITSSLWFVPVACVIAGAALSFATITIDRAFEYELIPSDIVGGPDAATAMLSTVAASMVSLTALVLTITMVVVQLAMGQFSPRIVQRILQDKPSQFAIGLFVATFVHAILTLREVTNNGDGTGQVPGVAILTAFVLVVISVAVLVVYVHHIGEALRVSALIELVSKDTRKLIDRHYPDKGAGAQPDSDSPDLIMARESGVVTVIGHDELVEEARRADCVLELVPALGQFVPSGAPLFRVRGDKSGLDEDQLHQSMILKLERTLDQDVAYGVRLLVDIAERSLSESPFLDPTTAVQAIDRLHDILRQLVRRPFPDGRYRDAAGEIRLVVPFMSWEDYLHLAFDEIRLAGAESPQATRRLKAALLDLRSVAPANRIASIDQHLELLAADVNEKVGERDSDLAATSDPQGMGVSGSP